MQHTTTELSDRLLRVCTKKMLLTVGYKVHDVLMMYGSQRLYIIRLHTMVQPEYERELPTENPFTGDDEYIATSFSTLEHRFEPFDGKSLLDIGKRFTVLRRLETRYSVNQQTSELGDVLLEIDFLNDYLQNNSLGTSLTEQLKDLERKYYESINAAVTRFWKQVRKRDEELYWLLKAHLKIGKYCVWYDDDPISPLILPHLSPSPRKTTESID